jgi:UDP-N-acetylmuramoylalanine--D-glutamate ligase
VRPRPSLPGGPYLVVGLARSGVAAALALHARGEEVIALDSGHPEVGRLRGAGVEVHLDVPGEDHVPRARTLVKSPGVPQDAPVVRAARAAGLAVIGEIELAWRLTPNPFVAVTGTNGKTTTTELVGAIHRAAGRPVAVAGNVGTALSSVAGRLAPEAWVACECSSFQLEDTEAFAPEGAVLLNLAPDHVDRHGTFEAYVAAKLRIFANQAPGDVAVVPDDLAVETTARTVRFGVSPEAALRDDDGMLWWEGEPLLSVDRIRLPGLHNRENAMAAAAVTLALGIPAGAVAEALEEFRGVAHRLELVATHDGVRFYNDSKATNVASTLVALRSFADPVHLIAGGRGKGQDFTPLAELVREHCRAVYLIGEDAPVIAAALAATEVPLHFCRDLERAVAGARAAADPGDVVLLSPACASFDQYTDFEARGEHFRELVA